MVQHLCIYVFLLASLGVLCSCPKTSSPSVLRVWDWAYPASDEKMRDYLRESDAIFLQEHPELELQNQHIPFGPEYIQKVMAGIAADSAPDCFFASVIWANDLYERGALLDLRPYLANTPELGDDAWLPSALNYGRDGDYVYGLPMCHDAYCIVYNLDLFEEAGISTDFLAFSTWEDLRAAAVKLTKRDDDGTVIQAGFMVSGIHLDAYLPWMYANGGQFYSADRSQCLFNDEPMREAMQFLQDLQYRDQVSFPLATARQDLQLFLQGKVAMYVDGLWAAQLIESQAPNLRFGMMSFPRGPHGTGRGGLTWSNLLCIPKAAKNPDAAWQYIAFHCSLRDSLLELNYMTRNSAVAALYDAPEWQEAVVNHPWLEYVPQITEAGGPYPVVRFTEISAVFSPLCQGVILNSLTPQEALDIAEPKVARILHRSLLQREMDCP